ncbi:hypothetical protein NP493_1427g01003 [Ridgeia piscesae]|uniref:Uncharacterized protein n=1 Tax=Ridgeia piscesae TaxID=27915 RepID=A0AAD9K3E1_RIDPI|nr:hypothetical protein NP493_1427g01003 [Ridgeia piscesae]
MASGVINWFQDKEYGNWVKVGKAQQCTARGLGKFCKDVMEPYHRQLIQTLPRTRCYGTCGRRNPDKECVGQRNLWKKHLTRGSQPFWFNCDMSKWEASYWELAKVFMMEGQPATANGPNTTDPIGIFHLIMQCDLFDPSISNRQCVSDVSKYVCYL